MRFKPSFYAAFKFSRAQRDMVYSFRDSIRNTLRELIKPFPTNVVDLVDISNYKC